MMYINREQNDPYASDFYETSDAADLDEVIDFEKSVNDTYGYVPAFAVMNGDIVFYARDIGA